MRNSIKRHIPLLFFLVGYLIFSLLTYRNYGISYDEHDAYSWGRLLYNKVRGNDPILQKDFVISKNPNGMAFYNNFYAMVLYMINGGEDYEIYHFLNMLFASLAFIAVYELLLYETKNRYYALAGPLFLVFTPRFFGDIPSNPKDMPFAVYYTLSLAATYFFTLSSAQKPFIEKIKIVILGLLFGLTASQRLIGYSIFLVYFIFRLMQIKVHKTETTPQTIFDLVAEIVAIFIIGFFVHMATMPILGADPINNFIRLLNNTKSFPWGGSVLLFGKQFADVPRYYIPLWVLISTPLFVLFLVLASLFFIRKSRLIGLMLLSIIINLAFFIGLKPTVYDGVRHGLFLIPQIIVLSVLGFKFMSQKKSPLRWILVLGISLNMVWVLFNYITMHPYEVIYFNILAGRLQDQRNRFETDYWGLSSKEVAEWFYQNLKSRDMRNKTLAVNGNVYPVVVYADKLGLPMKVVSFEKNRTYDYVACWDRWNGCDNVKGKRIGTISRQGLVLNSIYQTK